MQLINKRLSFTVNDGKRFDKISQYWRKMADQLAKRLDEGVLTDSLDNLDHGVQPMDANVLSYKKEGWCYPVIWGIEHVDT